MAACSIKILTLSVVAKVAVERYRGITADGGAPVAGGPCLGFTDFAGTVGERVSIGVLGTVIAEAGGQFATGAPLELDGLGRVVVRTNGVSVGHSLAAAVSAGSLVEILIVQGTQAAVQTSAGNFFTQRAANGNAIFA